MNIDDLSWQARHHGGVSPGMVQTLLDLGQSDLVIRAAQERGDWNCAQAAARELCAAGQFERALALLAPFTAVGWQAAAWATAEIMIRQGRGDEALAMVRPDAAGPADAHVCARYAELSAKAGRVDEAVDLLIPHLGEFWVRSRLVDVTQGQGHDDRVLDVLAQEAERMARLERTESAPCAGCGGSCAAARTDRWHVLLLISRVLERAGRADEAVEVLRTELASGRRHPVNFPEHYAELLARRGLVEELGALAAAESYAAFGVYVKALEDGGRPPGRGPRTAPLLRPLLGRPRPGRPADQAGPPGRGPRLRAHGRRAARGSRAAGAGSGAAAEAGRSPGRGGRLRPGTSVLAGHPARRPRRPPAARAARPRRPRRPPAGACRRSPVRRWPARVRSGAGMPPYPCTAGRRN